MSKDEWVQPDRGAADQAGRSRREFVGFAAASLAGAAVAGYAQQSSGAETPNNHRSAASDHGPQSNVLNPRNPDAYVPPETDNGEVQSFWSSFSLSHRRIQPGRWTRQVNIEDFPISQEIAGVNMRLTAGGIRELHWHKADEWALMLYGNARITCLDFEGHAFVGDVAQGDLWYFPTGMPHSIQGLSPDSCEFLLVFDEGKFSQDNTTLLTDWTRHTPQRGAGEELGRIANGHFDNRVAARSRQIHFPSRRSRPAGRRYQSRSGLARSVAGNVHLQNRQLGTGQKNGVGGSEDRRFAEFQSVEKHRRCDRHR